MEKQILKYGLLFILIYPSVLVAQKCDTIIDGEKYNCLNQAGQKHGVWLHFEKKKAFCFDTTGITSVAKVESFKNGVPHGWWKGFPGEKYNDPPSYQRLFMNGELKRELIVLDPWVIRERNYFKNKTREKWSLDIGEVEFVWKNDSTHLLGAGSFEPLGPNHPKPFKLVVQNQRILIIRDDQILFEDSIHEYVEFEMLIQQLGMKLYKMLGLHSGR